MVENKKLKVLVNICLLAILCLVMLINHFGKDKVNEEDINLMNTPAPKVSTYPTPTKRSVTLAPTLKPTSKPTPTVEPTPYVLWEINFDFRTDKETKYMLSCNSLGELTLTNLESNKSSLVECGLYSFTELSKIEFHEYDLDSDSTNEFIVSYNNGLDFNPSFSLLFFKEMNNNLQQIPFQEILPNLTLENPERGLYTIVCKETVWRQSIKIEDESFYHDPEGNLYELYLRQPSSIEMYKFSDGKMIIYSYMRIEGYTGTIEGYYSCTLSLNEEKLIIEDQIFEIAGM